MVTGPQQPNINLIYITYQTYQTHNYDMIKQMLIIQWQSNK